MHTSNCQQTFSFWVFLFSYGNGPRSSIHHAFVPTRNVVSISSLCHSGMGCSFHIDTFSACFTCFAVDCLHQGDWAAGKALLGFFFTRRKLHFPPINSKDGEMDVCVWKKNRFISAFLFIFYNINLGYFFCTLKSKTQP